VDQDGETAVSNHFRPYRHRLRARHYREIMNRRVAEWKAITVSGLESSEAMS